MKLISEKVVIEDFVESDISEKYISWLNDNELMKYSEQRHKFHTHESCLEYLFSFQNTGNLFLAIKPINSSELVGTMTVYVSAHNMMADMGILVGKEFSGRGIGAHAWSLVLGYLLNTLSLSKVTAGTLKSNVAMLSIMKKNEMVSDGIRKDQSLVDGEPVDIICMAKFH